MSAIDCEAEKTAFVPGLIYHPASRVTATDWVDPRQTTIRRLSMYDVFMVTVATGYARLWQVVDLSGPSVFVIEHGEGDPPEGK